jgi:Zn-dependent protease with chaperone function
MKGICWGLVLGSALFSCFVLRGISDPTLASLSSVFTDSFQFDVLGNQDVSDKLKQEACIVFKKLELPNPEKIQVKRMSAQLKEIMDKKNCGIFATHNAIFVDEAWVMSLSKDQRTFYLGHEATHIKNKDTVRKIGMFVTLIAVMCAGALYCKDKTFGLVGFLSLEVLSAMAYMAFYRHIELQADNGGALIAPIVRYNAQKKSTANQSFIKKAYTWLLSWFDEYHVHGVD